MMHYVLVADAAFGHVPAAMQWRARPGATADSETIRRLIDSKLTDVLVWSCDYDYLKLGGIVILLMLQCDV